MSDWKVRLKKDLPIYAASQVFHKRDNRWLHDNEPIDKDSWIGRLLDAFTDALNVADDVSSEWFEMVDEAPKRWRADDSGNYWYADSDGLIESTSDCRTPYDDLQYELGNYFRTRKQAEAAANAIKEVLAYVQDPSVNDHKANHLEKAKEHARQAWALIYRAS